MQLQQPLPYKNGLFAYHNGEKGGEGREHIEAIFKVYFLSPTVRLK